jgi:CheY-like chemotaxis protein
MQELVGARDEAAKANLAKSQFLANMSHEIRTPLNGVLGMAQVMERDELSPRQADRLHIIQESGGALLALLNDILDVSKIEVGKLELEDAPFDLVETVRAACAPFREIAERKGLGFSVRIGEQVQGLWRGDALRVRQVVSNLVSNAVKFTAEGRVSVELSAVGEGVTILVKDTGVGIPRTRLSNLFEKFVQADASTSREYGGSGLGLAISRELVELMHGKISVESDLGRGSAFSIHLPLARAGAGPLPPRVEPGEGAMRILAVEDNVTNRLILESLLAPLRGSLTLVANGREAVEAVKGGGYELVLMDIQMPLMNGVEATRAIRAWEAETGRRPIPILAVTANLMADQVQDYLNAGMNGVIAKPIETGRLIAAMTEAVEAANRA